MKQSKNKRYALSWLSKLKRDVNGLIPAVAQDFRTGEVLMVAFMNDLSFRKTLQTGRATYWSRSRQRLWIKGEESGNIQKIKDIRLDCDMDCILLKIEQVGGAACHTGRRSCFFHKVKEGNMIISGRKIFDPGKVYGQQKRK